MIISSISWSAGSRLKYVSRRIAASFRATYSTMMVASGLMPAGTLRTGFSSCFASLGARVVRLLSTKETLFTGVSSESRAARPADCVLPTF